MCGICGVVQIGGEPREVVSPETLDAYDGRDDPSRPQRPRPVPGRRRRVRRAPPQHRRRRGRPPAVRQRDRRRRGACRTASSTTTRRSTATSSATGTSSARAATRRSSRTSTRSTARGSPSSCAASSRSPSGTGASAAPSWPATASASSRSTGRGPATSCVFASELKSLLASGLIGSELDYEAIDAYLTFGFFSGPRTPLAGVSKLRPGHRLVIDADGVSDEPYWTYPEPAPAHAGTVHEWGEGLLEQLEDAVRSRLMTDVPLGAMLSGGLDSSVIVALMARNMAEPVKTFSVGFARGRRQERARRRAARREHARHGPPRARAVGLRRDRRPRAALVADRRAARRPVLARLLRPLRARHAARHRGAVRPGRRRAVRRLRQAPRRRRGRRVRHAARPGALAGHGRRAARARPRRPHGPHARRAGLGRPPAGDERPARRRPARTAVPRPAGRARRRRGPPRRRRRGSATSPTTRCPPRSTSTASSRWSTTCSTTSTARRWRTRSRSACRSSTTTWSSTRPRSRREHKVHRVTTTKHVLKEASRGLIPDRIIDKRKLGFFAGSVDGWFAAQAERQHRRLPAVLQPALRRVPRPRRGRRPRAQARRRQRPQQRPPAAGDPDARGLAVLVPAAREPERRARAGRAARRRRSRSTTRSSPPCATRPRTCRGSPRRSPPRRVAPAALGHRRHRLDRRHARRGARARRRAPVDPRSSQAPAGPRASSYADMGYHGVITRAFEHGRRARSTALPDVVVKLDADISFEPDHFERLLAAFAADAAARDRERLLHRARGRRVAAAAQHRRERLGRGTRLPARDPRARAPARAEHGLGRDRRAQGAGARLETRTLARPAVPPPPRRGRARRQPLDAVDRARPRLALHGLPELVPRRCARCTTPARSRTRCDGLGLRRAAAARRAPVCPDPAVRSAAARRARAVRSLRARRRDAIGATAR